MIDTNLYNIYTYVIKHIYIYVIIKYYARYSSKSSTRFILDGKIIMNFI